MPAHIFGSKQKKKKTIVGVDDINKTDRKYLDHFFKDFFFSEWKQCRFQ